MRLIDADALIGKFNAKYKANGSISKGTFAKIVNEVPTLDSPRVWTPCAEGMPTTGEIVEVLRENGDVYFGETEITCEQIADRLESQEREIVGLTELNKAEYVLYKSEIDAYRIASESLKLTILRYMDMTQTLTARAEQAEKERDALMKECDTGRTAGYKEGLEEGYKKGRDEGYDTAWKEARYEMNEY